MTRGERLNNPGNLIIIKGMKYKGEIKSSDDRFRQFETLYFGTRAMMKLLRSYVANGFNTIRRIIEKWAPSIENKTEDYIRTVSLLTDIEPDALVIDTYHDISSLMKAMCRVEQGKDILTEEDMVEAWKELTA